MKIGWLLMMSFVLGCQDKPTQPSVQAPEASTSKPVETAPSKVLSVKTPDGKTTEFVALMAWNMDAAGSKVPQLEFHTVAADCADRTLVDKQKFYTSFLGDLAPSEDGEPYNAPNWGYSALPDFVPGSAEDQGYPPPYWGKVTITKADDKTVEGTVDFADKGVEIKGAFVAKRCPDM
ncbi:MAG: hypothetical protein R3E66_23680 [bacterium]